MRIALIQQDSVITFALFASMRVCSRLNYVSFIHRIAWSESLIQCIAIYISVRTQLENLTRELKIADVLFMCEMF